MLLLHCSFNGREHAVLQTPDIHNRSRGSQNPLMRSEEQLHVYVIHIDRVRSAKITNLYYGVR